MKRAGANGQAHGKADVFEGREAAAAAAAAAADTAEEFAAKASLTAVAVEASEVEVLKGTAGRGSAQVGMEAGMVDVRAGGYMVGEAGDVDEEGEEVEEDNGILEVVGPPIGKRARAAAGREAPNICVMGCVASTGTS